VTRVDSWYRALHDRRRPVEERADAARALAALGTDDALASLADALESSAWTLRARIAESLGLADHPRARRMVGALIEDPDPEVACAAVQGIAWRPGDEAAAQLMDVLGDGTRSLAVRCGAARALARVGGRGTAESLAHTIAGTPHDELRAAALTALIRRPLREVGDLLPWLLAQADGARRIAILEALADAPDDVAAVVAPYLADVSGEVREAAALALAGAVRPGAVGERLATALASEREPAVRFALYDALANQVSFDLERIVPCVVAEPSPELQLAGAAAAAAEVSRRPAAAGSFERAIVPMLTAIALAAERSDNILAAVAILAATCTGRCLDALRVIATCPEAPAIAARAASGSIEAFGRPHTMLAKTPRE
jgi:HEAT repeat protein